MFNVNETVTRYLACWNETDPARRRNLIAQTWTESGTYTDAHRRGDSHESIDAMIAAAQRLFPGYRLTLRSGIEAHNTALRFSWAAAAQSMRLSTSRGPTSPFSRRTRRLASVTGFTDAAPAAISEAASLEHDEYSSHGQLAPTVVRRH